MNWPQLPLRVLLQEAGSGTWGREPDPAEEVFPVLRSTNIQDGRLILENAALRSVLAKTAKEYALREGDILVTTSSGSPRLLGKNAILETLPDDSRTYLFSNFTWRLRPAPSIVLPKYLFFYLNSLPARATLQRLQNTTSGLRNLNTKLYLEQSVPLPPISEQRRIVEILDQADRLRRLRAEADAKADRILPALFIKTFGDPATNPKGWPITTVGAVIANDPQNGLYKPASEYGTGTKILRIDSFYAGRVTDLNRLKRVRLTQDEVRTYGLNESEVVVNRVNSEEHLGKSAIVPTLDEAVVFESNMMRLRMNENMVHPAFVLAHLQTPFTRREMLGKAKRAINQTSINQQDVKALTILLPPRDLQRRFAQQVFAVEHVEAHCANAAERIEGLFQALLRRAFTGDLTASWREGHAKDLLEEMEQQSRALAEVR